MMMMMVKPKEQQAQPLLPTKAEAPPAISKSEEVVLRLGKLRKALLYALQTALLKDDISLKEGYTRLLEYASPEQARLIFRYPDLVEEVFERIFGVERAKYIPIEVSEVARIASERKRNFEKWEDYYSPLSLDDEV
jgi:hypothetical protein